MNADLRACAILERLIERLHDQVLAREPRHFGALSGLGMIKRKLGDLAAARTAFGDALAINPNMDGVKRALEEIDREERPL
jgi:cytochrome c-type biogenesis protein CcmH/NrfG